MKRKIITGIAAFAACIPAPTAQQGGSMEGAVRYRVPVQASLDGNTVEMATEQTAFAENALAYRSSLSFLSGRVNTLTRALKGE